MSFEYVTITEPTTGARASIAPKLGFNCFSFRVQSDSREQEMLWSDPAFMTGTTRPSRSGIPILFPFAGRIREGRFAFDGRDYELERSDANAIHGFVYTRAWRVVETGPAHVVGEFQAAVDDPAILSRWPSDFRIQARYEVQGRGLVSTFTFTNTGERTLPWWFGTHPYFRCSAESIVTAAALQRWELVDLLPTGHITDIADSDQLIRGLRIGDRLFDDAFTSLLRDGDSFIGTVSNPAEPFKLAIEFGTEYSECVVFIPPHREAICIEPYTSVPNAFELAARGIKTGLRTLAPGESTQLRVVMRAE